MVSVVGESKWGHVFRHLSKSISVAIFVTGTAIFASVNLLSLVVAVAVLTLTLAAGVFGRAIASWIVTRASETEPMIHVIAATRQEAYQAIAEILCLKSNDGRPFQMEFKGHIFINGRRVASRSPLKVAILGMLAEPYDLANSHHASKPTSARSMSLNPLSPQSTNVPNDGVWTPFLPTVAAPLLPTTRIDPDAANSMAQQSVRSAPFDNIANLNHQIPRKVVSSTIFER